MIVICFDHVCDDYDGGVAAGSGADDCFDHVRYDLMTMVPMLEGSDAALVMPVVSSLVMIVIRIDHVCDDYDDDVAAGCGADDCYDHFRDDFDDDGADDGRQ